MKHDHTTTIRLPTELHKAARKKAIDEGRSLSAVIREFLREWLEEGENIELCKRIIRQPGFGSSLEPWQMDLIGYTPDVDADWPSYEGVVKHAANVLHEAGYDPTRPSGLIRKTGKVE